MLDPIFALCARAESHPDQVNQLISMVESGIDWRGFPEHAEEQGMAPLVISHFREAHIELPEDVQKILIGLRIRHQRSNLIRRDLLAEVLSAFYDAGLELLLLKGSALAFTVYPDPGLRPMRDIDMLVKEGDARRAQAILVDLGFKTWIPEPGQRLPGHHLPIAQKNVDGLTVSIEVHHKLLPFSRKPVRYEDLSVDAIGFSLVGVPTYTLSFEDMLWHIYRHSFACPLLVEPIRLIWVADFISIVEKHVNEINWAKIKANYPAVWNILPLFHYLSPWSRKVIKDLALQVYRPPDEIGQVFEGWPRSSIAEQRKKGVLQMLSDTFWPSEWWTLLYYGVNRRSLAWWWTRLIRHPLHIWQWVLQYLFGSK